MHAPNKNNADHILAKSGLCSSITLLMMTCCLRFHFGSPALMQYVLLEMLRTMDKWKRVDFNIQLCHWHRKLYCVKTWEDFEKTGMGLVHPDNTRCWAYTHDTERLCTRKPCPHHAFCRRHRHVLISGAGRDEDKRSDRLPCEQAIDWRLRGLLPVKDCVCQPVQVCECARGKRKRS